MLLFSPVELPSCVGPQFIETAIHRGVGGEETAALPLLHLHQLAFLQIPLLVEQLYIERAAHFRWFPVVCLLCVCLEPDGVAQKIAAVVHVDVYLFLRYALAKGAKPPDGQRKRHQAVLTHETSRPQKGGHHAKWKFFVFHMLKCLFFNGFWPQIYL